MNLKLKAIYYCATNWQRWGKGLTLAEAKANAGLSKRISKDTKYYVYAAVLNGDDITDEELENLRQCVVANTIDGSPNYYVEQTPEDSAMIEKYHVGWLLVEHVK